MIKEIFQKYQLPIILKDKMRLFSLPNEKPQSIYDFLTRYYAFFNDDLNNLLDSGYFDDENSAKLRDAKDLITTFFQDILSSLELYLQGYPAEAYFAFAKKMDMIQNHLIYKEITKNSDYYFCRIRKDAGKEWKDLFHIPFDRRELVKGYRYSVSGFPCLYLTGDGGFNSSIRIVDDYSAALSLAWFECGMPEKFYWSKFRLKSTEPLKILDLTRSPFASVSNRSQVYVSKLNKEPVDEFVLKTLITYPLTAACSIVVQNKDAHFASEYIIPQMLLSWVRKNANCRGIAYLSNSRLPYARRYNAFNIVLPPVSKAQSGHCEKLLSEFDVLEPQQVDVTKIFESLKDQYDDIKRYRDRLSDIYKSRLATDSFGEILTICTDFINIYEQVSVENNNNIEWVYQNFHTVNLLAQRMTTEKYHELIIDDVRGFLPNDVNAVKISEELWLGWKSIREHIRKFWNFDMLFSRISRIGD